MIRSFSVIFLLFPAVFLVGCGHQPPQPAAGDSSADSNTTNAGTPVQLALNWYAEAEHGGYIAAKELGLYRDAGIQIDIRQGRAEVHIPLFYPDNEPEIREMFKVMGRKNDVAIDLDAITLDDRHKELSGADIESVVLTARRVALVDGRTTVTKEDIEQSLSEFIPSAQGLEKDMQEVAAVLECTQMDFLNSEWREALDSEGGRSQLQQQLTKMRHLVEQL